MWWWWWWWWWKLLDVFINILFFVKYFSTNKLNLKINYKKNIFE